MQQVWRDWCVTTPWLRCISNTSDVYSISPVFDDVEEGREAVFALAGENDPTRRVRSHGSCALPLSLALQAAPVMLSSSGGAVKVGLSTFTHRCCFLLSGGLLAALRFSWITAASLQMRRHRVANSQRCDVMAAAAVESGAATRRMKRGRPT